MMGRDRFLVRCGLGDIWKTAATPAPKPAGHAWATSTNTVSYQRSLTSTQPRKDSSVLLPPIQAVSLC
jgi:hypothetical protein